MDMKALDELVNGILSIFHTQVIRIEFFLFFILRLSGLCYMVPMQEEPAQMNRI